jgi:hypothetical protein
VLPEFKSGTDEDKWTITIIGWAVSEVARLRESLERNRPALFDYQKRRMEHDIACFEKVVERFKADAR